MKTPSEGLNQEYLMNAQQEFVDQCELIEKILTKKKFKFVLFRDAPPYRSFLGDAANGRSQKVIIDKAGWKVTVQELEGAECVSQCVFNVYFGHAENLAKQVMALVKANR